MKKTFVLLVLFLASAYSQYTVKSDYLNNPDLAIPYVDSCAKFWMPSYDSTRGGFYTNVARNGTPYTPWGTQKNCMTQSRHAYGLTRAFQLTGNEWYLKRANDALQFMYNHAWDNTNGGWYWELDINGTPTTGNTNKTAFYQHYALVGIAAYFEATADTSHWSKLMAGYQVNEQRFWDSRPSYFGYYDECAVNWSYKKNKSFNATVDAVTTHLLTLYLMTGDAKYKTRLMEMRDNMIYRLAESMPGQQIGFVESYDSDWAADNSNTNTIMGHVLKTAWCLGRLHQLFPDTMNVYIAKALAANVWNKGYDHQYGGPYKDYNRTTGQMLMWSNPDTAKAWWQMEQGITCGLMLYDITKNPVYLQMADETMLFYMKNFVDHTYGEVYENQKKAGGLTWGDQKGNGNKASYHSIETGYYTYLYGKLMLNKAPASLYYYFSPAAQSRTITLNPLEIAYNRYKIKEVTLNGLPFTSFNASARQLNIAASAGGKFKVTFEPVTPVQIASAGSGVPTEFSLGQNYPNPFNPSTVIRCGIPAEEQAKLSVYDVLGRKVLDIKIDNSPGAEIREIHITSDDMRGLASGTYVYMLAAGNKTAVRKMIYLK